MKHLSFVRLSSALLLLLSAPTAQAQVLQLPFTGEITSINVLNPSIPPPAVQVGDAVNGLVGIDLAAAVPIVLLGNQSLYSHPTDGMRIVARIDQLVWAVNQSGLSSVKNDYPVDGDLLSVGATNFGQLPFPGATNGSINVRWQDSSTPHRLLFGPTLPNHTGDFDPSQATSASGVISGGAWSIHFSITSHPLRFIRVDDSTPTAPVLTFEVLQPTVSVDVEFAGAQQALGALSVGQHQVTVQAPLSLSSAVHELTATVQTSGGTSLVTAQMDTRYLPEVIAAHTWPVFVVNIGLRTTKLSARIELRSWQWDLAGGRNERLLERIALSVTSTLPPDRTIPGGDPFMHHALLARARLDDVRQFPLPVVPGIGNNVFWSASFAAPIVEFVPREHKVRFEASGATSSPSGLALWNLGVGTKFEVALP